MTLRSFNRRSHIGTQSDACCGIHSQSLHPGESRREEVKPSISMIFPVEHFFNEQSVTIVTLCSFGRMAIAPFHNPNHEKAESSSSSDC